VLKREQHVRKHRIKYCVANVLPETVGYGYMNRRESVNTALTLIVLTIACSSLAVQAQNPANAFPPSTNTTFDSKSKFAIPRSNDEISFASGGSYANAALNGDVWDFTSLFTNAGSSALPNIFGVRFSVSAKNCDMTITHLDALNVVPPFPGQMDFTVTGAGTQSFNFHYSSLRLLNWTVYIDDAARAEGDGWTVLPDGWLNVTGATRDASIRWEEVSTVSFTSKTNFPIAPLNSSVNFGSGGTSLGEPSLVNETWIFQNLALAGSVQDGTPLWIFEVSGQNSNITIDSYNPGAFVGAANGSAWLNCTVFGVGSQNVSLGNVNSNGGLGPYVYIDGENRTLGNGWVILNDDWLEITGASANVSIYYPPNPELYNLTPRGRPPIVQPVSLFFFAAVVCVIIASVVVLTLIKLGSSKKRSRACKSVSLTRAPVC
jgi:hypothetical protein